MKVYIETYGCTFNKADAQIIAGVLHENDIEMADTIDEADIIIINTCYVKLPTENKVTYYRSLVIAGPIGILAAIYLNEYAKKGKMMTIIHFAIENLAGIPSS